ncbi:prephenate dehydrogenase [Lentisphaerota bacterium WC36G]|nr:prephenate dehydrogenase [Lentisphaerae bacterium WC36]
MVNSQNKINVAIIGLGLLGGSLAMALENTENYYRLGWTRNAEVRKWAIDNNVIDYTADNLAEILNQADITVLCLPIPTIMSFIQENAQNIKKGSVVTDIGSVKEVIVNCGEKYLTPQGVYFIGSHPMAGTEKSGPDAAFKELYDHAEVFITKSVNSNADAFEKVVQLWKSINTSVVEIEAKEHDILVAHTSHISHILALSLTQAVLDCDDELTKQQRFSGCATGFRDTSRIASSSSKMWREIIENNQSAVLKTVIEFEKRYNRIGEIIKNKDFDALEAEFAKGKELRDSWIKYKNENHNCNW